MDELQIGDVVVLKSGGPRMTVTRFWADSTAVDCVWHGYNTEMLTGRFPVATVDKGGPLPLPAANEKRVIEDPDALALKLAAAGAGSAPAPVVDNEEPAAAVTDQAQKEDPVTVDTKEE